MSEVAILRCICSPKCKLLAVTINGCRITPFKHSGAWDEVCSAEIGNEQIIEAVERSHD